MQPYLKEDNARINRIYIDNPSSKNIFGFMALAFKTGLSCDIIHIHYNHDCFGKIGRLHGFQNLIVYPILKLFRKPIITTFHENPDLSLASKTKKTFYKAINWAPLKLSRYIIVTTERTKELLVNQMKVPDGKIAVLPLGSFKRVKKMRKQVAKEKLGLQKKKIIVLFGFIDENKGHHLILDVLRDLPYSYHLLIAGEARNSKGKKYREHLLDLIEEYNIMDRVTFFGYAERKHFPLIMGAADLIVYPYSDITSSLALTTAISYKKPILTSDIEPFKLFNKEHKCTEVFRLDDGNDLILKIKGIIKSNTIQQKLRKKMEKFINNFNWNKIGKEMIDIYAAVYWYLR